MGVSIVYEDDAGEEQTISFDATLTVKAELGADITQLPVETKQNITDHIRPQLDRVSVEAFVTNTPVPVGPEYKTTRLNIAPTVSDLTSQEDPGQDSFLSGIPTPGGVNRALQSAIRETLFGPPPPADLRHADIQFSDRVREIYDELDQVRIKGTECRIVTKFKDYEGMHISLITPLRGVAEGDGASFSLEFQQVRVSETSTRAFPVPAETRAKKGENLGARSGKDPKDDQTKAGNKSLLLQGLEAGGIL